VIRIYTTPYCGYCVAAKRLLTRRGYRFEEIDVSRNLGLRARVSQQVGHYRTVPMIFIDDEFIRGYDELVVLDESGELAAKMEAHGAHGGKDQCVDGVL
jgi:glutaredoxin 3